MTPPETPDCNRDATASFAAPPGSAATCWNCEEWEPIVNENRGWCPVFSKETEAMHGSQCTAFRRLPDPTQELPACACVSHDAVTCAAKRDGLHCDDPRYEVRRCECICHSEDREDHDD